MTQQPGGQPKYMVIAGDLRSKIEAGFYPVGSKLPPVHELGEQYGVAPNTVLSAIKLLVQERVAESFQGDGTYVRSVPAPPLDVAGQLTELRERVEEVSGQAAGGQGAAVLERIGAVEAALMDLYAKLGYEYPGKTQARRHRKAAGA
jgi:DNA-binding transcriptional regulator YhcF (GntR family)